MYRQGMIDELLSLARWSLIRARITRQEAVVESEFDNYYEEIAPGEGRSPGLHAIAHAQRVESKNLLQQAEKLNGELYLKYGSSQTSPLRLYLRGKNFRTWVAHRSQYNKSRLFRGVDPE